MSNLHIVGPLITCLLVVCYQCRALPVGATKNYVPSGRQRAPSKEFLEAEFHDVTDDHRNDLKAWEYLNNFCIEPHQLVTPDLMPDIIKSFQVNSLLWT